MPRFWAPLRAVASGCSPRLPTCSSPSSCPSSAGANGAPSPKYSQLPPLRSQSPRPLEQAGLAAPLSPHSAPWPAGQTARPGLSIASPGALESSLTRWYLRAASAGKEGRARVGLAGGTRLHALPCKSVDIQAAAQSPSQGHQSAWWGQERRGSWAQGHCQELPSPFGPSHARGHVLLAREGELGWGGQGVSAKTLVWFCILLGSSDGASPGAGDASLFLKTTAWDPVKRLSVWGQSSSGPESLARSRPSITRWRLSGSS